MASKNIKGITIEIGGNTTGLDKALKDVEKGSNSAKSELKEVDRALKNAPQSAVLWAQKQELLTKAIEESKKKLELLENAQEQVEKQFQNGEIGEEQYRAFQREVENTRSQLNEFRNNLDDTGRQAESAGEAVEDAGRNIGDLGENAEAAEEDVDDLGEAAEDAGDKAEESGNGGFTVLKGAIADLAADGIRAAIDGFKELATEGDTALNTLKTKTGATAEEMSQYHDVMNNLYANNYGEDRNDLANSIAEVKQQLGDISGSDLENVTETALMLRDTFEFEVNESVRAADMLIQQFGITANEAYTLIAQGAQNGLNKNGDLMDVINEYGVHYSQMGYSAEEFFNSLANGTEAGTFSVDKLGDAMKEFGIRQREGADETVSAWAALGLVQVDQSDAINKIQEETKKETEQIEKLKKQLEYARIEQSNFNDSTSELTKLKMSDNISAWESDLVKLETSLADNNNTLNLLTTNTSDAKYTVDELMSAFNSGGEVAKEASNDVMQALFALEDETIKNQLGVQLFGTMWEDLQATGVEALTNVNGTADKTADTLEKIADTKYNDLGSQFQQLGREVKTDLLEPIAEKTLPKIKDGTDWLIKHLPEIKDTSKKMLPLVEGIGAGFVAWKAVNGISQGIGLVKQLGDTLKTASLFAGATTTGVVGLVAALAVGTGSLIWAAHKAKEEKLEKVFDDATQAANDLSDAVNDNVEKMSELKTSAAENIETDLDLTEKTKNLWKELQNLVDENGNVKSGYEDRVEYIRGELSEATGEEIELVDGQIQKYDELKSKIEEAIEKQRAQIKLDGYSEIYSEALKQNADASKEYVEAETGIAENRSYIGSLYAAVEDDFRQSGMTKDFLALGPLNRENLKNWKDVFTDEEMASLEGAFASIDTYNNTLQTLESAFKQNAYDISMYEQGMAAYQSGVYDEAERWFDKIGDLRGADLADSSKTNQERLKLFENSIDQALREYDAALKLGDTNASATFEGTIQGLVGDALDGGITMGDLMSSGIIDKLDAIDGFDAADLINYARDAVGWEVGNGIGIAAVGALRSHINTMENEFDAAIAQITSSLEGIGSSVASVGVSAIFRGLPMMASGGTLHSGSAIVAEAGPELIEIMNGGARVTPLTGTARNTAAGSAIGQKVFYNTYNVTVEKISSDYDVKVLSQRLAAEQRKIESGKGK